MENISQRIKKLITDEMNSNVIVEGMEQFHLINDLGMDSMQVISLVMDIEQEFDFEFDDDEMEIKVICDFKELVKLVEKKLK